MKLNNEPVARTGMLIRKPISDVFEAFVDPAITSQFWFSAGTGKLEQGKSVRWDWRWYGFSADVDVKAIEPNKRILVDWGGAGEEKTSIEWLFELRGAHTLVSITSQGFKGGGDEKVAKALDMVDGFAWVLAGAKAWLEHGIALGAVPDRHPDAHVKG